MIITNLIGGLGNQMFQYACGRACSLDVNAPLAISTSMFHGYALHQGPELTRVFAIDVPEASDIELKRSLGWQRSVRLRRLLGRPVASFFTKEDFIAEPHFNYWPGIRDRMNRNSYLQGYWQSEQYFSHQSSALRNDFRFREEPRGKNAELAERIVGCEALSLHVRRGDYLSNPKTLAIHGVCSQKYYEDALAHVLGKIGGATIFAFSDDPAWVAKVLLPKHPNMIIVDHNKGADSYNDMRLMSLCQHHIIANSSFSWWAAWLNPSATKIVVAPDSWFASGKDSSDLIPKTWMRI